MNYVCTVTESFFVTEGYMFMCASVCVRVSVYTLEALPKENGFAQTALMSVLSWLLLTQCM